MVAKLETRPSAKKLPSKPTKKRPWKRILTDIILLVSFTGSYLTGDDNIAHYVFGSVFGFILIVHLWLGRRWIRQAWAKRKTFGKKMRNNAYLDLGLFGLAAYLIATGVFAGGEAGHETVALLIVAMVIVHLLLHRIWIASQTGNKQIQKLAKKKIISDKQIAWFKNRVPL